MDVDQAARSNAQEYFGVKDPDFYEFEGNSLSTFHDTYLYHWLVKLNNKKDRSNLE